MGRTVKRSWVAGVICHFLVGQILGMKCLAFQCLIRMPKLKLNTWESMAFRPFE